MMNLVKSTILIFTLAAITLIPETLMATEEAEYTVVSKNGDIEIRDYAASIVAETIIDKDFEAAGSKAFRPLFNFISGDNTKQDKIAMTSPVAQEKRSEKISMTSPVGQRAEGEGWAVSFMMPASYTMAVIQYSGRWSEKNYQEHLVKLQTWISQNDLEIVGEPAWARYDPPFKPWFMRRNEVLIPIR